MLARCREQHERHRADRRRRVRRRAHRAAELLEHDRRVDHAACRHRRRPRARAARRTPSSPSPLQTASAPSVSASYSARTYGVIGARSARKRRTDVAQHLLFGRELEVHAAPRFGDSDVRKLPCAPMRLQYAPEDEAFRAELDAWLDANQPPPEHSVASRSMSSAHMPEWARDVAAHAVRQRAGWCPVGRRSSAAATRRRPSR